jgi:hypothetical protein
MAVAFVQEFAIGDRSTENYDWVANKIGEGPIDGLVAHTAGFDDESGVFRIFDIWESQAQAERFIGENLATFTPDDFPNPTTAAEQPSRQSFYDLHNVVRGTG